MCDVLNVNRSAYYHWINNGCIVNKVDEKLNQLIKDIFYQYREVYGTRRIKKVLVQEYYNAPHKQNHLIQFSYSKC